jgi:hypothetical protein
MDHSSQGVTPQHNVLTSLEKRIRSRMDPKLVVLSSLSEDDMTAIMRRTLTVAGGEEEEEDPEYQQYLHLFNESVSQLFEVILSHFVDNTL